MPAFTSINTANDNHYQFNLSQNLWTACSGQVDEDDGGVEITATYPIQQWLTNCLNQSALWQVKHGDWRTREVNGALRMYQLAALIEAVPRISLSRCTVKMRQRPTLWPTQRMSHQDEHCGCHQNVTPSQFQWAGAWATPGAYVYIHWLLHRLGLDTGNHYQLPFVPIHWVTDVPICRCCHCLCS